MHVNQGPAHYWEELEVPEGRWRAEAQGQSAEAAMQRDFKTSKRLALWTLVLDVKAAPHGPREHVYLQHRKKTSPAVYIRWQLDHFHPRLSYLPAWSPGPPARHLPPLTPLPHFQGPVHPAHTLGPLASYSITLLLLWPSSEAPQLLTAQRAKHQYYSQAFKPSLIWLPTPVLIVRPAPASHETGFTSSM